MSNGSLEWQARVKADTSELKRVQAEMQKTGKVVRDFGGAIGSVSAMSSGFRDAMSGNVQGLVTMAYGAAQAWRALSTLTPVLKILSVAFAVASAAQLLFNRRQDETRKRTEETQRAIEALGLSLSDLGQHQQSSRDAADSFDRIQQAASAAADAIGRMADAQSAFNRASGEAALAKLDLDEARELQGTNDPEQQRGIRQKYAGQRNTVERQNIEKEAQEKRSRAEQDRARLVRDAEVEAQAGQSVRSNAEQAQGLVNKRRDEIAASIAGDQKSLDQLKEESRGAGGTGPVNANTVRAEMYNQQKRAETAQQFSASFDADPVKAINDFADKFDLEAFKDLGKVIENRDGAVKRATNFDASAQENQVERERRAAEIDQHAAAIEPARQAALAGAETRRLGVETSIVKEESSEQRVKRLEQEAKDDSAQKAGQAATADERRYRYDKLDDRGKLGIVDKAIERTQGALKGGALGDEDQAKTRQTLIEQLRERDSVRGRIGSDEKKEVGAQAQEQERVAKLSEEIEKTKSSRSQQDMGTRDVFEHMYAVKDGKNPDEIAAANSERIATATEAITVILEELKR